MFRVIKVFTLGMLAMFIAGGAFAYTYHVIRTDDGLRLVRKAAPGFEHIYVDVRDWGALDFARNRPVANSMARAGFADAEDAVSEAFEAAKRGLKDVGQELRQAGKDLREVGVDLKERYIDDEPRGSEKDAEQEEKQPPRAGASTE